MLFFCGLLLQALLLLEFVFKADDVGLVFAIIVSSQDKIRHFCLSILSLHN